MALRECRDLTGQRFKYLTAIVREGSRSGFALWVCVCDCGRTTKVISRNLIAGGTSSCGCKKGVGTHGMSNTPTFRTWASMIGRCTNPKDHSFAHYGGRGIRVSNAWLQSFETFLADMGERPKGLSLERKDNNGPYSKTNCKWATPAEQSRNTRRTRFITFNGETLCMKDWAERVGLPYLTVKKRIDYRGWSVQDALTRPLGTWLARLPQEQKHE